MLREDRFLISKRPYAVDLSTLRAAAPSELGWSWASLEAVWFRRRSGVTVACIGRLRDLQRPAPADAADFLKRHDDGRHGGDCHGRWDGENYWGAQKPVTIAEHLALLRPMLDNYPDVPDGYDGWWRF